MMPLWLLEFLGWLKTQFMLIGQFMLTAGCVAGNDTYTPGKNVSNNVRNSWLSTNIYGALNASSRHRPSQSV